MKSESDVDSRGEFLPVSRKSIYDLVEKEMSGNDSGREEIEWGNKKQIDPNDKVSVFDVASYILEKCGELTTMKLHKLLYYAHAWSLVWDEEPLFDEKIEAWANGPVVRELFSYHKGCYSLSAISIGNPNLLNKEQKETIDSVLEYYGDKSAQWLIELTHLEEPWRLARKGLKPLERGNNVITNDSMANYYSAL